ncbi:MAG: hypothetical protein K9M44_01780, partial [Candidatus Pacebacteria bacterium]|nr:hypothetical protein [Candidatus Paceibacterota bacterium]
MRNKFWLKINLSILVIFLLSGFFLINNNLKKAEAQIYFPKLSNYFLNWQINSQEAEKLAKWDLLILDMEVQENNPEQIRKIRNYNPDIKILAYITSQEIIDYSRGNFSLEAPLRAKLYNQISDNWWLRDSQGDKLSFWPGTYLLNISDGSGLSSQGKRWNDFLPEFVSQEILSTGLWDGVFYDNVWGDISWLNTDIQIAENKKISQNELNAYWKEGTEEILKKTRDLNPESIILGNGRVFFDYQKHLNGMMLEDFPSSWENGGSWAGSIQTYLNLSKYNKSPQSSIVLRFGNSNDYKNFRFGFTSALLGNGYFGYNYHQANQGQLWWFDEYNIDLGQAENSAYNLLTKKSSQEKVEAGLWRRDFSQAVSIVNSTGKSQKYVFEKEEFEKISGYQDPNTNNGTVVNWVNLKPEDGVILLKRTTEILDSVFDNGAFVRVFNENGEQIQNGFFAYKDSFPAQSQIIISDIDNDTILETLVNYQGEIKIYKNGQIIKSFLPFASKFYGEISVAISDLNGDGTKEIITGAGQGGGPHVRVFSKDGKPLIGGFFAYDRDFRGGVNVAVLDLNGDGTKEIITGAGQGGGPHVRVFSKDGKPLIGGFFAYDRDFRGG